MTVDAAWVGVAALAAFVFLVCLLAWWCTRHDYYGP